MFVRNLFKSTAERPGAAEQFMDEDGEGVLIAGAQRTPFELFRSRVYHRTLKIDDIRYKAIGNRGGAEVVEDDLVLAGEQHVLRLDIAVNYLVLVNILQGFGDLARVGNNFPQ